MRDYKKEYREYHSSKTQKLRRAMRNKANRKLNPGPGKEVDHKTPLSAGGSNSESNWRVVSKSTNRKKYNKTANLKDYLYDNAGMLIGAPVGTVLGYNYDDDPSLLNALAGTSLGAGFGLGVDMLRREGLGFFFNRPAELLSSKALSTVGGIAGGLPGAAVGALAGTNLGSRIDKHLQSKTASEDRKIRPRVALWLHDGKGNLLVEDNRQKGLGFKFPAGGIDPGQSINEAARREALEEVGYSLAESPRAIPGIRAVNVKWDPVFLAEAAKKGRNFWGSRHYHRIAKAGDEDRSLLGSEGDALNASWIPASVLLRETRNAANDPNNKYNYFDKERLRVAEVVARLLQERQKTSSDKDFSPDFTPEQLKEMGVYDEVYGDKPSKASMKEWPDHWINKQDPLGWLQWYERYSAGRRTEDDARQIKRWKSFKSRHLAQYKKKPTERREAALRNWGIDVKEANYSGALGAFLKLSEKGVAEKTNPSKWEAAKREAKAKMGGKHSARAMQLATQIYKKKGGGYSGDKPSAKSNKLKKWTKQDWQWSGERKKKAYDMLSGSTMYTDNLRKQTSMHNYTLVNGRVKISESKGVYLPAKSIDAYRSSEEGKAKLRSAVAKKNRATERGDQFSSHGLHKGKNRSKVAFPGALMGEVGGRMVAGDSPAEAVGTAAATTAARKSMASGGKALASNASRVGRAYSKGVSRLKGTARGALARGSRAAAATRGAGKLLGKAAPAAVLPVDFALRGTKAVDNFSPVPVQRESNAQRAGNSILDGLTAYGTLGTSALGTALAVPALARVHARAAQFAGEAGARRFRHRSDLIRQGRLREERQFSEASPKSLVLDRL